MLAQSPLDPETIKRLALDLTRRDADRILLDDTRAILRVFARQLREGRITNQTLEPVLTLARRLNPDLGADL